MHSILSAAKSFTKCKSTSSSRSLSPVSDEKFTEVELRPSVSTSTEETKDGPIHAETMVADDSLSSPPTLSRTLGTSRGELKYFDAYHAPAPLSSGYMACINLIAAGSGYDQRFGREIVPKSLEFMFQLTPVSTAAEYARVLVVHDSQSNLGLANPGDVLDTAYTSSLFWSYPNFGNLGRRFTILFDWTSDCLSTNNGSGVGPYLGDKPNTHRVKLRVPKKRIRYNTSSAAAPAMGAFIVMCYGQAATSNSFYFGYNTRLVYLDG
jgi:hypothetical protein